MPCTLSAACRRALALAVAGIGESGLPGAAIAANPTEALEMPRVEVVGTTPLPGLATPMRDVPANVQIFSGQDLSRQGASNLGEFLEDNPTSVTVNSVQGNPFQADINYRGFAASPVLGTPQGISVFQDGIRINEPFGDIVNWDLIPPSAISSIQLIPGSNPTFGLNTLGGALAIYTKSGSEYPGGALESYAGSFGRKGTAFELGGKRDEFDYFLTANSLNDHGWAERNPSTVRQAFGKIGWQNENNDLDISMTLADNRLEGTQTLPVSWFDSIRRPYTYPDINDNKLTFITAKGSHILSNDLIVGGNVYYRKYSTRNFNSNVNGNYDPILDPVQATNDVSAIDQDSYGLGVQMTLLGHLDGRDNQLVIGTAGDFGRADFRQDSQTAAFTLDRGTIATSDFTRQTDAATSNRYWGLFFSNSLKIDPLWTLTIAGRYNRAMVKIEDRSGTDPLLNGQHTYSRFNPAVGLNYSPSEQLTTYATYNEGTRTPTPIELACADPNAPCKLPNNFVADPDLKMVVSRNIETGARGKLAGPSQWSAAIYRTELTDDIQFVSAGGGAVNAGYFQNVGKTRRQGIELSMATKVADISLSARYSYVDASFQSSFDVNSPSNSSADPNTGAIRVSPGDHIPGIPRHSLKLRAQYEWTERTSVGVSVIRNSEVFARGDENNRDINGQIPGYTVVGVDGHFGIAPGCEVFARVSNLFNRKYANFGLLGENFFNGPGRSYDATATTNEQFRGPGAPRGVWVGLRYRWL